MATERPTDSKPSSTDDSSRFVVNHNGAVNRILQGVMRNKALVTMQPKNGAEFLITTIVAVDTEAGFLYLGCDNNDAKNKGLLKSPTVSLSTFHDRVRVQFASDKMELVSIDSSPLFRIPIPETVQRFQRREYFRLETSLTHPLKCMIPLSQGKLDASVVDISIGGIGILAYEQGEQLKAGDIYHGCHLTFPEGSAYLISLSVCSTYEVTLKTGALSHRAGCEFINLPTSIESEIQRYIFRLERERRQHA